ncbi:ATP-binding protein [Saccharicrinis sp. 156]|uniref:ATP-binding protein n=1 Tax=Saccharicrinis sp. 156 TaxID=3417574 RepID=UPI003D33094C
MRVRKILIGKETFTIALFIGLLLILGSPLLAQSEYGEFENITKKEGLLHLNITSLFKDSKGFIWVGSVDGLMRYDGVHFDLFRKGKRDSSAISDNAITFITEDINDYIFWVGTLWGGINRVDIIKNDYVHFPIGSDNKGIPIRISCIHQISKDVFLVGTYLNGLYFFNPSTGKFTPTGYVSDRTYIYDIIKGSESLWVLSAKGLVCVDKSDGRYQDILDFKFDHEGNLLAESGADYSRIRGLLEEPDGFLVFTMANGLYKYNLTTRKIERQFLVDKGIVLLDIEKDRKGNYWISSIKDGLLYYDVERKIVKNYRADQKDGDNRLISNQIKDLLYINDQDVLFVATRKGISKFDYHQNSYKKFNVNRLSKGKTSEVALLFKDSQGTYWISSQSGKIYKKTKNDVGFASFDHPYAFYPYQFLQTDPENVWLVSNIGLYNYNLQTEKHDLIRFKQCGVMENRINHLNAALQDESENIWLLGQNGLVLFNTRTHAYQFFNHDFRQENNGFVKFVSLHYSIDKKYLWFAERAGTLYKFNLETKMVEKVVPEYNKNTQLKPRLIVDLEIDEKGRFWIATYGAGLLLYDPVTNKVSDELAFGELESYVYSIVYDKAGSMWVSSNFGVSKINIDDFTWKTYDLEAGNLSHEFNQRTCYMGQDGAILFGGQDGFVEFDRNNTYQNNYKAPPVISAWSKKNISSIFMSDIYDEVLYINDTVVKYNHSDSREIKFYPSVLNYSHSRDNRISWMLEGYDENWIESYSSYPIMFNNLKPGSYTLHVKGINNDGVKSPKDAQLKIVVIPAFYQTLGFKILIALAVALIIYFIFRVRIKWYVNQKKVLVHMVNEKTKEISKANKELKNTKEEILKQNEELNVHRNYLEDLVKIRTKDLEKAKSEAEESDRLKTAFLANLSHEIRTPMNAIIGFSSLIKLDDFPDGQKKELIHHIGQSSETLLTLIDDIIDISRIETGNVKLTNQIVNVPVLIAETMKELSFEDRSSDVTFHENCELVGDDENVYSDKQRLKQVLSNLIRNAFKFTKIGHVKLVVKKVDSNELESIGFSVRGIGQNNMKPILFQVEDTGVGIEGKDLGLIFQPFQKAERNKEVHKGMGLGLSIVKNIIVLFGGDIIVRSELDKGTTFSFYINANPVTSS